MGLIPEWYDQNVTMGIMMGPCTSPNETYFGAVYNAENWKFMEDNEIWVLAGGPDWAAKKAIIDSEGSESLKATVASMGTLPNNSVQACAAYAQTSLSKRFGKYNPNWFEEKNPKSFLMDYGLVQEMKIAMFVGLWDNTCPLPVAQQIYENLGGDNTVSHWIVAPTQGHVPWGFTSSDWFMGNVEDALMTNADI